VSPPVPPSCALDCLHALDPPPPQNKAAGPCAKQNPGPSSTGDNYDRISGTTCPSSNLEFMPLNNDYSITVRFDSERNSAFCPNNVFISHSKERQFPQTALTGWALEKTQCVSCDSEAKLLNVTGLIFCCDVCQRYSYKYQAVGLSLHLYSRVFPVVN
jgi:hypothetical protein